MMRGPGGLAEAASRSRPILGARVDATSYDEATQLIIDWATGSESRYVCVAAVNNVIEARDDPHIMEVMNGSDLVTPDGMPLVWGLRWLGVHEATRVCGPDLTPRILERAAAEGLAVGFYGGDPNVLDRLVARARRRWPELSIVYEFSPPFRDLVAAEDEMVVRDINGSGARILFVGLGCPRQETWMASHRGRVGSVMVGVGAAFDYLAGTKRRAPPRLRAAGLEWLFRLATEPRRLAKRYLRGNPRFVMLFGAELLRSMIGSLIRRRREAR
jgi:N-acetylglucosaminyldiphosphoundecaprenol N-acetyl-beta-D-mannosaminyltransferase